MTDPTHRPAKNWPPLTEAPLNGGPGPERHVDDVLTATPDFFVRNHGDIPRPDAAAGRLVGDGLVERPLALSRADLADRFPRQQRPATLVCAGFRRAELLAVRPIPGELAWGAEPAGTAEWTGVRLADVLEAAGARPEAAHVAFEGLDRCEREGRVFGFGGSVPRGDVERSDILLAWEMNGRPLTPEHGFPLRVVAPGLLGARSVKWLARIRLQAAPSDNYFQARAYKRLPAGADAGRWLAADPLNRLPVNAVLCRPAPGATVPAGPVRLSGVALTGHPDGIESVELSLDQGATWRRADLDDPHRAGCWRRWSLSVDLPPGRHTVAVRARDRGGEVQPESLDGAWNAKGYFNNAWHRATLVAEPGSTA